MGETTPFSILPVTPQNLNPGGSEVTAGSPAGESGSDQPSTTTSPPETPTGQSGAATGQPGLAITKTTTATTMAAATPTTTAAATATTTLSSSFSAAQGGDAGRLITAGTAFLKPGASPPEGTASELTDLLVKATAKHVPVLMYHYVSDVPPPTGPYSSGLMVRIADFEAQMRYLAGNGYRTVGLGDLYLARHGLKALPPLAVIITFDDGGLDNYRVACPVLLKYGLKATFFVITGEVGAQSQMDWDDLKTMADNGMSVESHTVSHPDLTSVTEADLDQELTRSRTTIAENTGTTPESLSYPSGRFDERITAAAREAGYLMAVSTNSGSDTGPDADFQIRRIRVAPFESLKSFASALK